MESDEDDFCADFYIDYEKIELNIIKSSDDYIEFVPDEIRTNTTKISLYKCLYIEKNNMFEKYTKLLSEIDKSNLYNYIAYETQIKTAMRLTKLFKYCKLIRPTVDYKLILKNIYLKNDINNYNIIIIYVNMLKTYLNKYRDDYVFNNLTLNDRLSYRRMCSRKINKKTQLYINIRQIKNNFYNTNHGSYNLFLLGVLIKTLY